MAILNNSNAISSGGYDINNSLRLRSSASAYLSRTPASAGNRQKYTRSVWIKRGALSTAIDLFAAGSGNPDTVRLNASDTLMVRVGNVDSTSNRVFRDVSAWGHLVVSVDTTQATSTERMKAWWNNEQITWSTYNVPAQNTQTEWNNNAIHTIGASAVILNFLDGYLTEFYNIDGQALTPSSFGETDTTTGSWKPKAYTGTYGTNGFYLKFSDIATTSGSNAGLGKDFSGNANYWTTNNISVTAGTTYDAMTDSPTLTSATVANYATLNPVFGSTNITLSEANLKAQVGSTGGVYRTAAATFGMSSGKWYWELVFGNPTTGNPLAGVGDMTVATSSWNADTSTNTNFWYLDASNGNKINGTGGPGSAYGSSFTTSDICMVAIDMDSGKIWWGKNGTWFASGDPAAGTNAAFTNLANRLMTIALMGGCGSCGFSGNLYQLNFGQRPFSYTPPSGYKALNTYNLPDSTIKKGSSYMDATTYSGNSSTQNIVNAGGFRPDFVWIKSRSSALAHYLNDSVRGAYKTLFSNLTNAEYNGTSFNDGVSTFNSNGFTLLNGSNVGNYNQSGSTYVGWQWQAGQGSTSSNTSGSITSTVSVNTTAGFSVLTYTGTGANATVGHGLGVAPKMIIVKNRGSTSNWNVYHASVGNTGALRLNLTDATFTDSGFWNNTSPTSTVFTAGAGVSFTSSLAYCWAEIAGFSRFGSYTGNGSADGPFVFTNFRPKFILYKNASYAGTSWAMLDSSRNTYNVLNARLFSDSSSAEDTSVSPMDFTSNGFKVRSTNDGVNRNGDTIIYMAFAENPFKNSLAR